MGYYNKQTGKYVDDRGVSYDSYNDALAASNTRRGRATVEQQLNFVKSQIERNRAAMASEQGAKSWFGWIPGSGAASDRMLADLSKQANRLGAEQRVLTSTLNQYRQRMGEEPLPGGVAITETPEPPKPPVQPQPAPVETGTTALVTGPRAARESALTAMRQQYMPGASFWGTDEGKAIMQAATENQYTGDAAGLANYYGNQQKAGQGGIEEIISSMGYEGDMAKWARANQGLALREYNKKMANQPAPFATADNQVITTAEDGTPRVGEGMYGLDSPPSEPGDVREANNRQTAELQGQQMYDRTMALLQAAQRGY